MKYEYIAVHAGPTNVAPGQGLPSDMPPHVKMRWIDEEGLRCTRIIAECGYDEDADKIVHALSFTESYEHDKTCSGCSNFPCVCDEIICAKCMTSILNCECGDPA